MVEWGVEVGEMSLVIPYEIMQAARMTEQEMAQALAGALFQKEKLTQLEFQHLLASQGVPVHCLR